MLNRKLEQSLKSNRLRRLLVHHPFFEQVKTRHLDRADVALLLGQWWHPLSYFPDFLARSIAISPAIELKAALARILDQELGEGNSRRSHADIFIQTMTKVGFDVNEVSGTDALAETEDLVDGYRKSTNSMMSALGFAYGTEVADLAMVSSIGKAVTRVTGHEDLEWVRIHTLQEPNHVAQVNSAVHIAFTENEEREITENAEEMWRLWGGFFSRLNDEIFPSYKVTTAHGR